MTFFSNHDIFLLLYRRKQLLAMSEDKSKKILEGKLDKAQGEFVGRSGLTYQTKESVASKSQVRWWQGQVTNNACLCVILVIPLHNLLQRGNYCIIFIRWVNVRG